MGHGAAEADELPPGVEELFSPPAFAPLKDREAAFAVLRVADAAVLWANDAAAVFWGSEDVAGFGRHVPARQSGLPSGGPLDGLLRGTTPGGPPRLARLRFVRSLRLQNHMVMARTGVAPDGSTVIGIALPGTAADHDRPAGAWRRKPGAGAMPVANADVPAVTAFSPTVQPGPPRPAEHATGPDHDGISLARRSQIAILRDRLHAAMDGATSLRLLWRTDRDGIVTQIDSGTFLRLGTPVAFDHAALPASVATFDAATAARLAAAMATRATWSGITLRLPVANGAAVVPMVLSASPMFGPDRSFAGFRGFGTIELGQVDLATGRGAVAPVDAPPASAAATVEEAAGHPTALAFGGAFVEPPSPDPIGAEAASPPDRESPAVSAAAPAASEPTHPASGPSLAEPEPDRASPANVVQLRARQSVGRLGAAPVRDDAIGDPSPATDGPSIEALPAPPQDDDGAFQRLRDALMAQIPVAGLPLPAAAQPAVADLPATVDGPRDEAPPATAGVAPAGPEDQAGGPAASGGPFPGPEAAPPRDETAPGRDTDLIEALPVGVLVVGDRGPLYGNDAAARRLGYDGVGDMMGMGDRLLVSEVARTDAGVVVLRDAQGRAVATPAEGRPVTWQGQSAMLWTIGMQGPERVSPALAEPPEPDDRKGDGADQRSEDLLDRVDDAVALLDVNGRIRRLNRRGESWFTRSGLEDVLGQSFTQLLAPDSRAAGLDLLGEVREQKEGATAAPVHRDVVGRTADLASIPMLLTLGRLGASGFYATLRDLTALKRAEREHARTRQDHDQATGRLPEFLAKVSHEIRTPLNAILGFAEVMMDERFGPLGNARYKDYLKDIHASGTQVISLVSDLLDLSRIEAGRLDLDVGSLDVNKIVTETVALMQPEAHRERVIMRMSLGTRTPEVLADERSVRQIVHNLLSNAVKFNEPGGQVIVSTALSDSGSVVLRVRDTGIGMSEAEITAALEPFQAVSTQRPSSGNGLGLPLTRALVGANGASMAIRSRPREGTLVEVAFALASPGKTRMPA